MFCLDLARDRRHHALLVALSTDRQPSSRRLFLWWFGHPALASLFIVLTLLLFWKHSENIKRLQTGTEGKDRGEVAVACCPATGRSGRLFLAGRTDQYLGGNPELLM